MDLHQSSKLQQKLFVNRSRNGSAIDPEWPYLPIQPGQGLVLFIITLVGLSANVIAFLATVRLTRKQKNAINYLIIALAITDTYGIAFCTLPTLLCYAWKRWVGGLAMCNFQGVSTMFASLASGSLATAMAMERLFAIWKPFLYRELATKKKSLMTVVAIWSATMIVALFPLVKEGNFVRNLTGTYCTINWFARNTENIAYAVFYVIMGITLLGIVLFCNASIAYRLLLRGKIKRGLTRDSIRRSLMAKKPNVGQEHSKSNVSRKSSTCAEMIEQDVIHRASSAVEKQLAKTVAVISFLFVICWVPFIIRIICNLTGVWVNAWVDVQVSRLLLINFVLDPFLYTLSRKQCRDIVKGWLCCCCSVGSGRRHSLFPKWFHGMRKKHGSFISSSQTGSGHNINSTGTTTSNIQLLNIKSSSVNTTPDHSITDIIIHTSDIHNSETPSKPEVSDQKNIVFETEQSLYNSKETNGETMLDNEKGNHPRRLYSEVHQKETVTSLEKTMSLPNLDGKQKGKGDDDMTVNVGFMYDLAFQRQTSDG